jgi:cell division protein FtsI/penicillin-binding protein 2
VRWLGGALAASAGVMLVVSANVQALRADAYLVRPQMSVQADGGRRFQYNPRVLEALRAIPRGTIFDSRGAVVATTEPGGNRTYAVGPPMFHVLGDVNTRANWSAVNSSYVERDAEDLLRGFDDHATTVSTTDALGLPSLAVRRDYTSVVPLVRHRWEPEHPDVKAILTRSRDLRITVDARLQLAVAQILERAAKTSGTGQGAVVVLDADTGRILASVSYPWPVAETDGHQHAAPSTPDATTLSRPRPLRPLSPGSTFKMITAPQALREDPAASQRAFVCERLSPSRVGARIPGFGPPVFDDVHDANAHGRIAMHDAVVKSATRISRSSRWRLGSESLARTAAAAGITLNSSRSPERVRANLPHSGYGQGEVVATPLRIARVAAAIGTDGVIREAPLVSTAPTIETAFLSARPRTRSPPICATRCLAARADCSRITRRESQARRAPRKWMRPASHAWFAGFAPHGPATRRIAFAVVLEHAGYGGVAAAAVAGQVATAASSLGLIK